MLDMIISLFRDGLSGTRYIIYVIICSTLLFSIVGYLLKQKYGKVEFKVATLASTAKSPTSKPKKEKKVKNKKDKKSNVVAGAPQAVSPITQTQTPVVTNPVPSPVVQATQPQVVQTPTPVQQQPASVTPIPEPTLVAKTPTPVQQPQQAVPPTSIPDLGGAKTGNPAIDDDITTII